MLKPGLALRLSLLIATYAALFWFGHVAGKWLVVALGFDHLAPGRHEFDLILAALAIYVVLLAIPFVPGMEISVAIFGALGSAAAMPIYFATVLALSIAFLAGRLIPPRLITRTFRALGLTRAAELVEGMEPLNAQQRLDLVMENAPTRIVPLIVRHRYIALIVALNTPGNAILGGGGGIALAAGLSGIFSLPGFLGAIILAVLPVPLAIMLGKAFF
ncbi:MAG: hypothetical protein R3D67_15375 [Hyphomicrobiaceae bacterium]